MNQAPLPPGKIVNCPGKRVQDLIFVKELGKGAYGQVFQARNVKTQEIVAIKCIPRIRLSEHGGIVGQLLNSEVEVLTQINNEHVVRLIQYLESANQCYIVLEYCNSGDFEQLWQSKNKRIPESEAIDYMKQVLAGMQALHEKNVLHRDLKLANILIHNQTLKIADLGFCKQLKDSDQMESLSLGSLGNMAPEVVEQKPYGMAADMFSIGSMFYQLIFGCFPFTNQNSKAFLQDIRFNKPDFKKNGVQISNELKELIEKMLAKDPRERLKWTELYSHPLMAEKRDMRFVPLNLNVLQAGQIDTNKLQQFYRTQDNKQEIQPGVISYLQPNQPQKQKQQLAPIRIQEVETTLESQNQQQINQLDLQVQQEIQDEKEVTQYVEKYLRQRDQIAFLSKTLNEINKLIAADHSAMICLMMSKKICALNERLVQVLLNRENIFQTRLIDKIFQHQALRKFQEQVIDDITFFGDFQEYMLGFIKQNINSVSKFIQTEWQKEVSKERTHHFNEIFNEIVKDYIFKIPEKMEQEKDLQIKEKLLELQIHLADCLCYEQLEKKRGMHVNELFDDLSKQPLKAKQDILNQKLELIWL